MIKSKIKNIGSEVEIDQKYLQNNCIFLGERKILFNAVKERILEKKDKKAGQEKSNENNSDVLFFEIEKLNIAVDDIRRMISFVNKTSESKKIVLLSSFFWNDEAQNAMLKVLEETPENTFIFLFGMSEKYFLKTILSRMQKVNFKNINSYLEDAKEVLSLEPNERLDNKIVKKILGLKVSDYNFEKDEEGNEKKDRESQLLFLQALMQIVLSFPGLSKNFLEQILKISTIADIDGGSPHLFIDWLLLASPKIVKNL